MHDINCEFNSSHLGVCTIQMVIFSLVSLNNWVSLYTIMKQLGGGGHVRINAFDQTENNTFFILCGKMYLVIY